MKRLLVISWEMPPLSGPRSVQVTRTLVALAERGWRSRVVCFGPRSKRYQQDHRVSLERLSGGAARLIPVASPEEWLFVRALWRLVPPIKHLPDEKRVWIRGALQACRRTLAEEPADVIVSFAQPWSDHLIGLQLHRETKLPWVAHFSDPWVDNPYHPGTAWQRRIWTSMERDVIAGATQLIFVNRYALDRVMAKYPADWKARAHVVPQGFESHRAPAAAPAAAIRSALRIVYTGRFYDGLRTPETILKALAELNRSRPLQGRVCVEFIGSAMSQYQRLASRLQIGHLVSFIGRLGPEQAQAHASTADVLLTIDAPSDGASLFLPSKLVDYLPLRKPILGLTPLQGASADLLRDLNCPVVAPDDVKGVVSTLMALIEAHEQGTLAISASHDEVAERYDIRNTTLAIERVFDRAQA